MNEICPRNFFLNIKKVSGGSSFLAIKQLRKILQLKRIGHLGTLDPLASGVLPVAVGKATKLIQYLQGAEKEYITKIYLGGTSDTADAAGEITKRKDVVTPTKEDIEDVIHGFVGVKLQIPPKASAIRIDGKRAYDLQRAGVDFEIKPREVHLMEVELLSYEWPYVECRLLTGKGYYVRGFARDLGELLGTGGYVQTLVRKKVGQFILAEALTPDEIDAKMLKGIKVSEMCLSVMEAWGGRPQIVLSAQICKDLLQGKFIEREIERADGVLLIEEESQLIIGVVEESKEPGMIKLQFSL